MLADTIEPPNDDAMESDDEPRAELRPPINPMPNSRSDPIPSTLIPRGEVGGEVGGRLNLAHGSMPRMSSAGTRLSSAGTDSTHDPQQNANPPIRQNRADQQMHEVAGRLNLADGSMPRMSSAGTDSTHDPALRP